MAKPPLPKTIASNMLAPKKSYGALVFAIALIALAGLAYKYRETIIEKLTSEDE